MAAPGSLYKPTARCGITRPVSVPVSTKVVYGGAVPKVPITGQRVNHWLCAVFRIYAY